MLYKIIDIVLIDFFLIDAYLFKIQLYRIAFVVYLNNSLRIIVFKNNSI